MPDLAKLRVLLVEDEAAIAMLLEDMLDDLGATVPATAGRLAAALEQIERDPPDLAILDVNVAGEPSYPAADALAARGIPFIFATGYGQDGISARFRGRPLLQKPFSQSDLERALAAALAPAPVTGGGTS